MAELSVSELHFRYGRHRVLKGLEFSAAPGERVALFGPNGSGKSTLLSVLAGRARPQKGNCLLNGIDALEEVEEARGQLLHLGHSTGLYGHLSALENLRFFADLWGLDIDEKTLREALSQAGLERFADRRTSGFSAGMRKRAALARILVARPSLLLLDEPYSALDAQGVAWLNGILSDYADGGGTLLLVTHDPERVAPLSPRSLHLKEGRLGPPPGGELAL